MNALEVTTQATLNDTLALLEDVLDHLKRLPRVPVTMQLVRRIESHLQNPTTASARRIASEHERAREGRIATLCSAHGLPLVKIEVYADSVKLAITSLGHFQEAAFARLLAKDVLELPLFPRDPRLI